MSERKPLTIFVGTAHRFDAWCREHLGVPRETAERRKDAVGIHSRWGLHKLRGRIATEVTVVDDGSIYLPEPGFYEELAHHVAAIETRPS